MDEPEKLICAKEFVLVDEEGSPRANWAIDDGGQASINFFDRDGNCKLLAGIGKDGLATIALKTAQQFPETLITVDKNGDFKFACLDKDGENRFQITVCADGSLVNLSLGGSAPAILLQAHNGKGIIVRKE